MIYEEKFIFFPTVYPDGNYGQIPRSLPVEDHWFTTSDGVRLHGWLVRADSSSPVLLFSHGNAGNISYRLDLLRQLHRIGCTVFIYDYRGYGRSQGNPTEAGLCLDGLAAFDYVGSLDGIDLRRLVLYGRSIGGAVSVDIATHRKPAALILESTFSSARDEAAHLYPFLPARFFLRTKFDSESKIRTVTVPLLVIHGTLDSVVPIELGRRLFEAAHMPKEFFAIAGANHNDTHLIGGEQYFQKIRQFLDETLARP